MMIRVKNILFIATLVLSVNVMVQAGVTPAQTLKEVRKVQLDKAKISLNKAQNELNNAKKGRDKAQIAKAQKQYNKAKNEFNDAKDATKPVLIPGNLREMRRFQLDKAEVSLDKAQNELDKAKKGNDKAQIDKAQKEYNKAKKVFNEAQEESHKPYCSRRKCIKCFKMFCKNGSMSRICPTCRKEIREEKAKQSSESAPKNDSEQNKQKKWG